MMELFVRDEKKKYQLYLYHPSLAAAILFIVLFTITTGYHGFQAAKRRTYYFIPLIIGGLFEIVGYIGRALSHNNQDELGIFILQSVTLLVAPALFAASIYMVLGRIILLTQAEAMSPIRARWLTKIFVCGDVLSFLVQSGGGGLMAQASSQNLGKILILIGLFIQIIFFCLFLTCGGLFHLRLLRTPTPASSQNNWTKHLYTLYGTGILILIRSIFRVAEFAGGHESFLQRHEVFLYIFDSVLMLGVMIWFNIVHPGSIIGRKAQSEGIMMNGREELSSYERK